MWYVASSLRDSSNFGFFDYFIQIYSEPAIWIFYIKLSLLAVYLGYIVTKYVVDNYYLCGVQLTNGSTHHINFGSPVGLYQVDSIMQPWNKSAR